MRRSKREIKREKTEALRQRRAQKRAYQKSLSTSEEVLVERAFSNCPSRQERALKKASPLSRNFTEVLARKAPRLLEVDDYIGALAKVAILPWHRPLKDWKPKGKGRDTLFRSLCSHLLAKYPMPPILWGTFFEPDALQLGPVVSLVASGGSLFKASQEGLLPVKLTRKMCHDVLTTPGDKFLSAIRLAQVKAFGGDTLLHQAWMKTEQGSRLKHPREEEFGALALRWFCQHSMLDPQQIGPLLDYINVLRRNDVTFSLKGRSPLALIRGMEAWHAHLANERRVHGSVFKPSGYREGLYEIPGNRGALDSCWTVEEILTSKALAAEGRALSHCVLSYSWRIEHGNTSIWSMREDGVNRITIQVQNSAREIVQARGKFNRSLTSIEYKILLRWAQDNSLRIGCVS